MEKQKWLEPLEVFLHPPAWEATHTLLVCLVSWSRQNTSYRCFLELLHKRKILCYVKYCSKKGVVSLKKKRINANFPYGSINVAEHFSNILFILLIAHKQDKTILRKLWSLHSQPEIWNLPTEICQFWKLKFHLTCAFQAYQPGPEAHNSCRLYRAQYNYIQPETH